MKTTEQIKSEVVKYLNSTSKHLFVTTKGDFYKVLVSGDNYIVINGEKVSVYDINKQIEYHGVNTKCVIKHILFLIPSYTYEKYPASNTNKLKSIKNNKTFREKVSKIEELISGKTDKAEITKIITDFLKGTPSVDSTKKPGFFDKLFGK